jgi:hypothetical protein
MSVVADPPPSSRPDRRRALLLGGLVALVCAMLAGVVLVAGSDPDPGPRALWRDASAGTGTTPAPSGSPSAEASIPARPAPGTLPVIDYGPAPGGFPADPDPASTVRLGEGLHPTGKLGVYDAPGGRPLAFVQPTISGVSLTMPIVRRRAGWAAVLLPSATRRVGWLPPGGWETVPLRDLIVVARRSHTLTWLRDDAVVRTWSVTLGAAATPTPLGRSFILGQSRLPGAVYADTPVFALGSVPENVDALPTGLRGAHIGIHTWYHDRELGRNTSDGCVRLTRSGQRLLLDELVSGTEVVVVDDYRTAG